MLDIWTYFERRERELTVGSSAVDLLEIEIAPDDTSGTLKCNADLRADTELDAYIKVFERVALDENGHVEIIKYSY